MQPLEVRAQDLERALHRSGRNMNVWVHEGKVRLLVPHGAPEETVKRGGGKFVKTLTPDMVAGQILEILAQEAFGGEAKIN